MTNEPWHVKLRRVRRAAGYSSAPALAEALGMGPTAVYAWEQGESMPQGRNLKALEALLPEMAELQVSAAGDPRDPNGYTVHFPMDPLARAKMLAELLRMAHEEIDQQRQPRG